MQAEIISIGTELLLGQIVNTNASFLAQELHALGIESYFQTTVGDNKHRIHYILEQALKRADLVITTGGLGPTDDDITHEAISSYFNTKLFLDRHYLKQIIKKFKLKGYKKIPKINIKQAFKPKGAKWIKNKHGTANGIIWENRTSHLASLDASRSGPSCPFKVIMTFPGVPSELYQMWKDTAVPYLRKTIGRNVLYSKVLKFTGIGESALAEKIKPYFNLNNPTVAPYASIGEVKIRITAKSHSLPIAQRLVNKVVKKILHKTKSFCFGEDDETLEGLVAAQLISKKKIISIAESCTGGLLSKRLTDIPGSSAYTKLNVVTYSNESKHKLLNVPDKILKLYGAVSSQVAASMASGIRALAGSDIGFSITGIAGPAGGTKEKSIGLVYFGLVKKNKTKTKKAFFGTNSTRNEIRWLASQYALSWILKELKEG